MCSNGYPYPYKIVKSSQYQLLPLNFGNQIIVNTNSIYSIRICEYKENNVTPIGYRKISQIFNEEGLKTPRECV